MLITASQVRLFEDISANVKDERINIRIEQMQNMDIKPFMGLAFYSDMILHTTSEKYVKLLNGVSTSYTDLQGNEIVFSGLLPAMVNFTIARFLTADKIRYTATGPVVKKEEFSRILKDEDKAARISELISMGNAYMMDVEYFLRNNREDYPLWAFYNSNRTMRQSGARIRAIDKGNYNGFNAPQILNGYPWQ